MNLPNTAGRKHTALSSVLFVLKKPLDNYAQLWYDISREMLISGQ